MAVLYILAGPNGAGKTTFYFAALKEGKIDKNLPFINVDLIARLELGGYSEENFNNASHIARERIANLIHLKSDFMIESNLARSSDYDWIVSMKKAGYEIVLYFLCTDDTLVNIDRIERRVKEGGHYIAPHLVIDRYNLSLLYLRTKLALFKSAFLIDNTSETIKQLAIVTNNKIEYEVAGLPEWADKILFILKRTQH